jgi:hypothetical protein
MQEEATLRVHCKNKIQLDVLDEISRTQEEATLASSFLMDNVLRHLTKIVKRLKRELGRLEMSGSRKTRTHELLWYLVKYPSMPWLADRKGKCRILYSLVNFWRSKGLTVKMKKALYITTIANILLWGCESLTTIRKEVLYRLEVFHHSTIRYIFNISKWQYLATTRLSNERLRNKFNFITNM